MSADIEDEFHRDGIMEGLHHQDLNIEEEEDNMNASTHGGSNINNNEAEEENINNNEAEEEYINNKEAKAENINNNVDEFINNNEAENINNNEAVRPTTDSPRFLEDWNYIPALV